MSACRAYAERTSRVCLPNPLAIVNLQADN